MSRAVEEVSDQIARRHELRAQFNHHHHRGLVQLSDCCGIHGNAVVHRSQALRHGQGVLLDETLLDTDSLGLVGAVKRAFPFPSQRMCSVPRIARLVAGAQLISG